MGEFTELDAPTSIGFTLSPLGPDGEPLFTSTHAIALLPEAAGETRFEMAIEARDIRAGAAPALAGVEIGWNQQLDRLAALLVEEPR